MSGHKVCGSLEVEADDVPWVETKLDVREYMDIPREEMALLRRLGESSRWWWKA